MIFHTV